jgi:uncharacterized membrane protein
MKLSSDPFQAIVDIGARALSPGVNDPTSAEQAIDQLLPALLPILATHSPLVFTMNKEQIFVEEELVAL